MRVPGILVPLLLLVTATASGAPRTKEHEWTSAERAVRSEALENEVEAALVAALEEQGEEDKLVLVTEKEPVFIKDDDQILLPEVKPQDDDFVVPSYSPVGSENEFGSADPDKIKPSLILDIEKRLQAEMGQMEGQLSLLHKLISGILGPQVTLNPKEDFNPNIVVVNVPQQQGGIGDHNPFIFGFDPFFNDRTDNSKVDDDEAMDSWVHDGPKFPSLSDIFGFPDQWSNLPSNYSNSTHEIQHVNGSVFAVNETIKKQSGDGYNFFSHKQVINYLPEELESSKESEKGTDHDIEEKTEEKDKRMEENKENVIGATNIGNKEIMTINENEHVEDVEDVPLVENQIESEFSEFSENKKEAGSNIEDEVAVIPNWRNWGSQELEELPLGETLDNGVILNHEPLLLPSDQLVLPEESVFGRKYENEVHDHDLVDFVSDQLVMPEKAAYYDIRNHQNDDKKSGQESTYRDLSDDTRVNRITANKSGMRMIDPNAEIFDYNRVLEELKPIQ